MDGWGYVLMTASMVLFWGSIICGLVALLRHPWGTVTSTAEEVLVQRFARGEIDEQEYRARIGAVRDERSWTASR
jgi:putative membrane protein